MKKDYNFMQYAGYFVILAPIFRKNGVPRFVNSMWRYIWILPENECDWVIFLSSRTC